MPPQNPYGDRDPVVDSYYEPLHQQPGQPYAPKPYQPSVPQYGQRTTTATPPQARPSNFNWNGRSSQPYSDDEVVREFHAPLPGGSVQPQARPQARFTTSSAAFANDPNGSNNTDASGTPPGGYEGSGVATPGGAVDPQVLATAKQWGANQGYEWLLQNPQAISDYYAYAAQQAQNGETGIDAVDFFAARGFGSPLAGRSGYDTMTHRPDGTLRGSASPGGEIAMPQTGGKPDPTKVVTPPSTDPRVERYASSPGYEWIREQPGVVGAYEQEAQRLGQAGESGIDIVDWLAAKGYPSPAAERNGYNSYYFRDANFTKREGVALPPPPAGTENADVAAQWYRQFGKAFEGITGADVTRYRNWALQSGVMPPTGSGPDISQMANWWTKVDSVTRGGQYAGGANPNAGVGPVMPAMPPAPELTTPSTPATPGGEPTKAVPSMPFTGGEPAGPVPSMPFTAPPSEGPPPMSEGGDPMVTPPPASPSGPGIGDNMRSLSDRFRPQFEQEQEDLLRAMMHTGGVTGMSDSGGFGSTVGKEMNRLIGRQSADMGKYIFEGGENEANRSLQKYIADQDTRTKLKVLETESGMQKYMADLNATLTREGIKTNADLERELAKLDAETKKYGIDANDILERYKADLAFKGIKYSADAGVSAAGMQAAAAGAAQAAAGAARQAEMEFQRERLKYEDVFNQRQYDLGLLNINRDIYGMDLDNQYKLMMLQWYMSPEARIGGSPPGVPGMFPYGP